MQQLSCQDRHVGRSLFSPAVAVSNTCIRKWWERWTRCPSYRTDQHEPCSVSNPEVILMDQINVAYERMLKSDVHYRFVIDIATLKT